MKQLYEVVEQIWRRGFGKGEGGDVWVLLAI